MGEGLSSREGRAAGCLFGLAFGDALGAPTEFLGVGEILRRWPPAGPSEPPGELFRVTDDTQMALAVGEAIVEAARRRDLSPATLEALLREAFAGWLNSPDNNRAPVYDADPCLAVGAGWVAEEALAAGLLCFLLYAGEPLRALQRAAVTSGDSDSIACLTGAFAGAHLGAGCWPQEWARKIEYRERLALLSGALSK